MSDPMNNLINNTGNNTGNSAGNNTGNKGKHIHVIGIAGSAMSPLAGMLRERGFRVTGSDERRVGKECSLPCRSRWSPYH